MSQCEISGLSHAHDHGHQCPISGCSFGGPQAGCGCPISGHAPGCPISGHPGQHGCQADPFANVADLWLNDFTEAIREVKLEILKAKVRKELGPILEMAADAVFESAASKRQVLAALAHAQSSKEQLGQTLRDLFTQPRK